MTQEDKQLDLAFVFLFVNNLVVWDNTMTPMTGMWLLLYMNIFFHCMLCILTPR